MTLLCVFSMASHAASPQLLEAYGRLPNLEDVALSPDGTKLAFVRTTEDSRILAVVAIAEQKFLGGAKLGETKLRRVHWADNDHLLIITSTTGMPMGLMGEDREWSLLSVYSVATHKFSRYPEMLPDLRMMNVVTGPVMVRNLGNDTILYIPGLYVQDRTLPAPVKVNLSTGSGHPCWNGPI